jgi:hypothetical protein
LISGCSKLCPALARRGRALPLGEYESVGIALWVWDARRAFLKHQIGLRAGATDLKCPHTVQQQMNGAVAFTLAFAGLECLDPFVPEIDIDDDEPL